MGCGDGAVQEMWLVVGRVSRNGLTGPREAESIIENWHTETSLNASR